MRIGIDLGGTKIEIIALDDNGSELYRERVATPQNDYAGTINAITQLVTNANNHTRQTGSVGIGIPGAISPATSLVKNANSICLIGKPLQQDLQEQLGCAVRIENDANCFVVSEATDGAAKNSNVVFGVIIGTGTGGGLVVNGQLVVGANSISGEWGHNPLPWPTMDELPGRLCYCGKTGCIETWLSGPGFTNDYNSRISNDTANNPANSAKNIIELAEQGEQAAQYSIACYEDRMARALASIINIIDPNVIVLGGGMSKVLRLYKNVPGLWQQYVFSDQVKTKLVPPQHGDSSGVRGAAWLWGK